MERENLAGDAKGKSTSGSNREAESTDAPESGGLPCSSYRLSRYFLPQQVSKRISAFGGKAAVTQCACRHGALLLMTKFRPSPCGPICC